MKKIFTILTAIFITTSLSYAQQFGLKGGLAMTNLYGEDSFDEDDMKNPLKLGLNVAGFARFGDGPMRFSTELGFSQKGLLVTGNVADDAMGTIDQKMSWNLNYIDVNAMGNYFISDYISLNAGLGISFLMSGKLKSELDVTGQYSDFYDEDDLSYEDDAEIGEDLAGLDFGANIGASFYINDAMHVNARYYLGLAKLDPSDNPDSIFNNAIMISFGYGFGGGYY